MTCAAIITALSNRANYCFMLGHRKRVKNVHSTCNDLVNLPKFNRCKHCSRNLGEE